MLSVPEYYIREVVESTKNGGIPEEKVEYCAQFLIERRSKLLSLVKKNQANFPSVEPTFFDILFRA